MHLSKFNRKLILFSSLEFQNSKKFLLGVDPNHAAPAGESHRRPPRCGACPSCKFPHEDICQSCITKHHADVAAVLPGAFPKCVVCDDEITGEGFRNFPGCKRTCFYCKDCLISSVSGFITPKLDAGNACGDNCLARHLDEDGEYQGQLVPCPGSLRDLLKSNRLRSRCTSAEHAEVFKNYDKALLCSGRDFVKCINPDCSLPVEEKT